jgi:drug/metabolite transporter (DMT)-like permease
MDKLPIAVASIYTYINPAVAVLLGWMFLNEPLHSTEIIAMAIILLGVAIVKGASARRPSIVADPPIAE